MQVEKQTKRGIIDLVGYIGEQQAIIEQAEQSIKTAKQQLSILVDDYDAEALDELILSDPVNYAWLKDYQN